MRLKLTSEEIIKLPLDNILMDLDYKIDRAKSSKNFVKLKNENGDCVIISRNAKEHYLYWNPHDDKDKGNIFNFCKNRGMKVSDLLEKKDIDKLKEKHSLIANDLKKDNLEILKIVEKFSKFKDLQNENFLHKERGISNKILMQLANDIKMDKFGNVCIPTYTTDFDFHNRKRALQNGYHCYLKTPIKKNKQGNLYQKPLKQICYGLKGLEIIKFSFTKQEEIKRGDIDNIIITESSIDSLSLFEILQLHKKAQNTLICATNGTLTSSQIEILESFDELQLKRPKKIKVFLGFDNDIAGEKNTQKALQCFKNIKPQILKPIAKDFNDDLMLLKILDIPKLSIKSVLEELELLNDDLKYYNSGKHSNYTQLKEQILKVAVNAAASVDFALKKIEIPRTLKRQLESNLENFNKKLYETLKLDENYKDKDKIVIHNYI